MTICSFAGHRNIFENLIRPHVTEAIHSLLQTDTEFIFYSGGMGNFDHLCEAVVRAAKHRFPKVKISLVLVLAYMTNRLNTDKDYFTHRYDDVILPDSLLGVHFKAAIQKRNRWMVDRSDYIIACIDRDAGGAFQTVRYAQKAGKTVIDVAK